MQCYYPQYQIKQQEDGSFDIHYNFIFYEIMSRRRIAHMENRSVQNLSISCSDNHLVKSKLFNSQITLSIWEGNISDDLIDFIYQETVKTNQPATIPMRIISDGRKAYVRLEK